jgi:16S rRNA (adenine1518-N6/adenine1519-N6)-dimethyltransferase
MAWVRRELDSIGVPPLKRFGQHFLIDRAVRERLIELAELTAADTVLEVGPGLGFLTSELVGRAGRTIAIEKDRALAKYLTVKFSNQKSLTVIQGDALTAKIPDGAKIVSSPPYNISSKLVLLIMNSNFQLAALLMQEEFVKRLTATSGSRDYGRISVMLQSRAQAEFDRAVSPDAFYPKPRISSALVTIRPTKQNISVKNEALFVEMVRTLFTQRRRKLRGVLTRYIKNRFPTENSVILQRIPIADKRVYELSPDELLDLSNHIADAISELGSD